ncbi:MAG: IS630 family transposase [Cytophagales bacterium]|nr:IS630 family transposase [Cytophagales bacterium]
MASIGTITISEWDREALTLRSRSHKLPRRDVLRAQIILLCASGKSYDEIQSALHISRPMINKWKGRYKKMGIAGLKDQPRSGKPAIFSEAAKARVIQLAYSPPGEGYTNWSQRRIASAVGMSQSKVHQILSSHDLKPHKVAYWCGKSTDPEFEEKMLNVIGLYLSKEEKAMVLSVDEKTKIQALDRSQPELPLKSGLPKRHTVTYKRNGTVSLMAALAVHEGEVTAQTIDKNNHVNFLKFLKKIYRKYPDKQLHIIVDNLNVHKHKKVKEWVNSKKRLTMHFTPTYSSWLNQIEIWFNILSKDVLKGAIWHSKQQLVDQLMEYVQTYNATRAKPFQWNYAPHSKLT